MWEHIHGKIAIKDIIKNERIIDFKATDNTTFQFLKHHDLFDMCINERHLANNIDALASLVSMGYGYSVLTEAFAEPFLKDKKLINITPEFQMKIEYALAWYPRHEMPDYFSKLIKTIK